MTSTASALLTPDRWLIRIVESLTELEAELRVHFVGGEVAVVASGTPDDPLLRQYLSLSLHYRLPLGVMLGIDQELLQVGTALCAEVQGVSDHPQHLQVKNVEFGGESAPRYLSKQHPQFEEMLCHLTNAVETQQPTWCIIQGSTIVAIKLLSHVEDETLRQCIQQHPSGPVLSRFSAGERF